MAYRTACIGEGAIPFLKWAGGKRWFVESNLHLFPDQYKCYIEPFLGSAAVFFALRPESALIADVNAELIETYKAIRRDPNAFGKALARHQNKHSLQYYYQIRKKQFRTPVMRASRFVYLNRTCFNGIYRVNLNGVFNVPMGSKTKVVMPSDDFDLVSDVLKPAKIKCQDFSRTIDSAEHGDFVFVDPPYTVAHNNNGFVKYNQHLFSWQDQERLCDTLQRANKRGAKFLLLNAYHQSVRGLYKDFKQFPVSRHSVIAAGSMHRGLVQELVVTNY